MYLLFLCHKLTNFLSPCVFQNLDAIPHPNADEMRSSKSWVFHPINAREEGRGSSKVLGTFLEEKTKASNLGVENVTFEQQDGVGGSPATRTGRPSPLTKSKGPTEEPAEKTATETGKIKPGPPLKRHLSQPVESMTDKPRREKNRRKSDRSRRQTGQVDVSFSAIMASAAHQTREVDTSLQEKEAETSFDRQPSPIFPRSSTPNGSLGKPRKRSSTAPNPYLSLVPSPLNLSTAPLVSSAYSSVAASPLDTPIRAPSPYAAEEALREYEQQREERRNILKQRGEAFEAIWRQAGWSPSDPGEEPSFHSLKRKMEERLKKDGESSLTSSLRKRLEAKGRHDGDLREEPNLELQPLAERIASTEPPKTGLEDRQLTDRRQLEEQLLREEKARHEERLKLEKRLRMEERILAEERKRLEQQRTQLAQEQAQRESMIRAEELTRLKERIRLEERLRMEELDRLQRERRRREEMERKQLADKAEIEARFRWEDQARLEDHNRRHEFAQIEDRLREQGWGLDDDVAGNGVFTGHHDDEDEVVYFGDQTGDDFTGVDDVIVFNEDLPSARASFSLHGTHPPLAGNSIRRHAPDDVFPAPPAYLMHQWQQSGQDGGRYDEGDDDNDEMVLFM